MNNVTVNNMIRANATVNELDYVEVFNKYGVTVNKFEEVVYDDKVFG